MSQSSIQQLIGQLEQTLQEASQWPTTGWPMRFGIHQVEVSSLPAAKKMAENFAYRLEALAYWNNVALTSRESVGYGQKALEALRQGDLSAAADALYFARFIEKRHHESSPTWNGIYNAVISQRNN